MGGYKVQGRTEDAANRLVREARIVEDAGAFALILEAIPMDLTKKITREISIPTIGIGAGPHCDGQVLVLHDVLGLFERFTPKFVKKYANLKEEVLKAVRTYKDEVEKGIFPSEEQSFK
jgi:3-methyl-2-oxobutanoate hydroxymethyltransferase